jgi:hypothetical protein
MRPIEPSPRASAKFATREKAGRQANRRGFRINPAPRTLCREHCGYDAPARSKVRPRRDLERVTPDRVDGPDRVSLPFAGGLPGQKLAKPGHLRVLDDLFLFALAAAAKEPLKAI